MLVVTTAFPRKIPILEEVDLLVCCASKGAVTPRGVHSLLRPLYTIAVKITVQWLGVASVPQENLRNPMFLSTLAASLKRGVFKSGRWSQEGHTRDIFSVCGNNGVDTPKYQART